MIRYLHRSRGKKGFTMAELIIVIAIMAVLMAMILPMFSSDDAEKQAAETYASDFYAAMQYNMTRYQLTEYHLTTQLQALAEQYDDDPSSAVPIIYFDKAVGGNIFLRCSNISDDDYKSVYLYFEVAYDNGIRYVKVAESLDGLVSDTSTTTSDHPFEQLLEKDLKDVMNAADKGHYYAVVRCDYNREKKEGYANLTVMSAHYCEDALPAKGAGNYKTDNLIFTDFSELKCGLICGTCSSDDCDPLSTSTKYVGTIGSYFLNVDNVVGNSVVVDV